MIVLTLLILFIIAAVGSAALGSPMLFVVRQQEASIIERLGKFNRIVQPGLHFLIPIIERRAAEVNLRTQEARYSLNGKTKDNVTIGTAVSVQFRVDQMPAQTVEQSGVYRSYYILSNPIDQMESYIADALRSAIPGYTLDEVFDNKDLIAQNVKDSVTELMAGYGYDIITTLITDIELPKDVERSMNAINSAQRDQEAAKALAEAERTKTVVAARAQAEAMEQTGIGIANQRKAIADGIAASLDVIKSSGVSAKEANDLFTYTQWVEMMGSFAESGKTSTILLPSGFEGSSSILPDILAAQAAQQKPKDKDNPFES